MNRVERRRRVSLWGFQFVTLVAWLAGYFVVSRKHPGLVRERPHPGLGAREGLGRTLLVLGPPWLAQYVAAFQDFRRHRGDRLPLGPRLLGLFLYATSYGVIFWAEYVNPFFSSVVRIQRERGHHVVTGGPYRYIRHPGYAAAILMALATSLALASLRSLLPLPSFIAAILWRTRMEDNLLQRELPGYSDYAQRVPYRLLPGVW